MFKELYILNKVLDIGRKLIPRSIFKFTQPYYHGFLSILGGIFYGFPSKNLKIIAVTGTKGKSTVVYMTTRIFEKAGIPVASIGSLGFKIKDKTWPNSLKMTMPGRMKLQKFLYNAKKSGAKYVILEATSEGLAQNRLAGINVNCAVFTGIHKEHIESHGSFENYLQAKQKLFFKTNAIHIINIDDKHSKDFIEIKSDQKITFGMQEGDVNQKDTELKLKLVGNFNIYNGLAALAISKAYGINPKEAKNELEKIEKVPGRMEFIKKGQPFDVVVDYAHTPDSLEKVYQTLKKDNSKLVCVLGAAGGGRDKWKRSSFGRIAEKYCDEIVLTNEDPYDENPEEILQEIVSGFSNLNNGYNLIINRQDAIKKALSLAKKDDTVIITGKGSETSMAVSNNKKIQWSDKAVVEEFLKY